METISDNLKIIDEYLRYEDKGFLGICPHLMKYLELTPCTSFMDTARYVLNGKRFGHDGERFNPDDKYVAVFEDRIWSIPEDMIDEYKIYVANVYSDSFSDFKKEKEAER